MDITLAARTTRIQPSPTLAVAAKAAQLRAAGHDIISLGAGEPDFDTPDHIKAAAHQALDDGATKYTAVGGTPELIDAIVGKFERENQLRYAADQILVSCGCKHSLYNLMQAYLDDGDEVIIPAPYWVSYPDMVKLAGATPVIIRTTADTDLKLTPDVLAAAMTGRTKLLILNSPSNPTGRRYTHAELAALGEVLDDHPKIMVASDDIYEHILWDDQPFLNIVNACPSLYERTVVFNGVSKAYAMTGFRIGYAGGPALLIDAMKKIQSQSTSNPTSISQIAATAALAGDQTCIAANNRIFKERHDYVHVELNAIEGVNCPPSQGTFYCFPNCQRAIERLESIDDDIAFAGYLLDAGVAVVPGSAFGAAGHMRISFATSMENLQTAMQRLKKVLG